MKKTIKYYVNANQMEIIKRYVTDLNGKAATKKQIAETINARLYLYGQIGFDNEVKKMESYLNEMARYASRA